MDQIKYYDFAEDKAAYPDAWLYVVYSGRGPGKTYSALWDCISNNVKFGYIKRTMDDIALISKDEFSPFKPINRDKGTCIKGDPIGGGLIRFYNKVGEDKNDIGYGLAMSAIHKFKGFDISDIDELIFDEFIPQKSERVNRKEGELLLDLYMTISRDRIQRGKQELKLVMLANSTNLACPVLLTLGLVDIIADMQSNNMDILYLPDKRVMIHHIRYTPSISENMGIIQTMAGSLWADASISGNFAYNDFSAVRKMSIKGMFPVCAFKAGQQMYTVWRNKNNGIYYCTGSKTNNKIPVYNLDSEIDAKAFYLNYGIDLASEVIDGNMFFSVYSAYDIISNFPKKFNL